MLTLAALTGRNRKLLLKADDQNSSLKSTSDQSTPRSSLIGSPRLFRHLLTNSVENADSPTSMLDTKLIFSRKSPSIFENVINSPRQSLSSKHIGKRSSVTGLAIVSSDTDMVESPKITTRESVFGSHLKIQVPPVSPTTPSSDTDFSRSPYDFGTKTPSSVFYSPSYTFRKEDTPRVITRQLSVTEMELSEDYTCVITHGPKPKTTHIFDNFVVESYTGVLSPLKLKRSDCYSLPDADILNNPPEVSSLCNSCEKNPGCENGCRAIVAYCGQVYSQKNVTS